MIFWILDNKFSSLLLLLSLVVIHFIFVKPLLLIAYYMKQGVSQWRFVPLIGPTIKDLQSNKKKFNDCIHTQKMVHNNSKVVIKSQVENIFGQVMINLYDPDLIKDFYVNKNQYYEKAVLGKNMTDTMFGEGLIFSEGEVWKKGRRITSKLLTFDFLNSYIPLIEKIVNKQLNEINSSQPFEIIQALETITGTITLSIFFGRTIENEMLYGKPISEVIKQGQKDILKSFMNPLFILSGGRYIPKKLRQISNDYKQVFRNMIKEQLTKGNPQQNNTLIDLYAREDNYIGGEPHPQLVEEILNQILNFYLAGRDTTSHQTLMILYYMSKNPAVKAIVQIELSKLNSSSLKWDDIKSLPYLEAVIKETQRIYGPSIGIAAREAKQDHKLGPINIKKGTFIQVGLASNNHNPRYYDKPFEFNPDRWLDRPAENQFQFLPFSAGARNCIGQHLSSIMTKIIVARFIQKYEFNLEKNYILGFEFTNTYTATSPMKFNLDEKLID